MHNNTLKPVVMIASAINRFLNNTHVCDDNSIVSIDCLCDSVSFLLRRQISSGRDSVSSTRSRRYEKGSRLVPSLVTDIYIVIISNLLSYNIVICCVFRDETTAILLSNNNQFSKTNQ